MSEDPEVPNQPSTAEKPAPEEAPDAPPDIDAAAAASEKGEASPSEADRLAEEQMLAQMAQMDAGVESGGAVTSSPSEADRIAEEQMLAQMVEADALEGLNQPATREIKEPGMAFDHAGLDAVVAQAAEFPQLGRAASGGEARSFDLLMDIKLPVSIELGRTTMAIADILTLGGGSIVELDKLAGEPVDLLVNDKIIAQGEVVVVDENFGIRITTLVSPQERIKSL